MTRRPPPRLRLGADRRARGRRAAFRAAVERRERLFGPERLADARALEPRPAAAGLALRQRRPARDDVDAIAKAAAVLLVGAARNAVPVLRRGARAWSTSRSRRTRSSTRRRAAPGRTSRGGTATSAGRRCRGPPDRAPGSRPAGRGSGSARTRPAGTSPRRPPTRTPFWRRYRRLLEARRSVVALRRGAYESIDAGEDDVYAWRRIAPGSRAVVAVNFAGVRLPDPAAGGRGPAGRRRDPPRSAGSGWRRRRHAAAIRGRSSSPTAECRAGSRCYDTAEPRHPHPTGGARAARIPQAQGLV